MIERYRKKRKRENEINEIKIRILKDQRKANIKKRTDEKKKRKKSLRRTKKESLLL